MTTPSSFTTETTSDLSSEVSKALSRAKKENPSLSKNAMAKASRIRDLESRGLIQRQQYAGPMTTEIERAISEKLKLKCCSTDNVQCDL